MIMYGYIYLTTNLINNKKYIGQKQSNIFIESYYGSGTLFLKDFKKYGKENFKVELLDICETREELNNKEVFWISKFNAVESKTFYNLAPGGQGFTKGMKFTKEHKNKISKSMKGKRNPNYKKQPNQNQLDALLKAAHKPASEKLKRKLSKIRKNYVFSEEYKKKLSDAQKGRKLVNNGKVATYVKSEDLVEYLNNGWKLGRLKSATTIM